MNAATWFYTQSFRREEPIEQSPAASTPAVGQTTVVSQWDGRRFVERELVWDGERFVAVVL